MTNTSKPKSSEMFKRAVDNMPLGVADSYRYWGEDKTVFLSSMKGCTITDCDEQTFTDFRLAYGPIILGYRDERVDNEVINAITNIGTISGFSSQGPRKDDGAQIPQSDAGPLRGEAATQEAFAKSYG